MQKWDFQDFSWTLLNFPLCVWSPQYLQNIFAKYFPNESVAGAAKYFPMKPADSQQRRVIYFWAEIWWNIHRIFQRSSEFSEIISVCASVSWIWLWSVEGKKSTLTRECQTSDHKTKHDDESLESAWTYVQNQASCWHGSYQPNLARQTIQCNDTDEMRISKMISMSMMFTGCLTKTCPVAPSL